jgi:hypothetical protein
VADNGGYGSLERIGGAAHASGPLRAAAVDTYGGRAGLDQTRGCAQARGAGEKVRAAVEIGEWRWDRGPKRPEG